MTHYIQYYDSQVGNGGIEHVFTGSPYQKGHGGIGRFLGGLFRKALPFLKRGARAVGKEALRAGMNIIDDVNSHNLPFKEALRNRARESGHNLKRKAEEKIESLMEGSGYKRRVQRSTKQSKSKRRTSRVTTLKRKRRPKHNKKTKGIRKRKQYRKNTSRNINKIKKRSVDDIFGPV